MAGHENPIRATQPKAAHHGQSYGIVNTSNLCVSPGPPYMQVTIEDVQVNAGERAKFQAVIEGTPQPIVLWFKVSADVSLDCGEDCKAVLLWGKIFLFFPLTPLMLILGHICRC